MLHLSLSLKNLAVLAGNGLSISDSLPIKLVFTNIIYFFKFVYSRLQKRKSKSALSKMKRSSIQSEDCGEGAMSPAGGERDGKKSSGWALTIERDVHIRRNPDRNVNSVYKKEKYKLKDENGKEKFTEDEVPMPLPKVIN